jgi:RND family efflux transporter MFP subunit
MNRYFSTLAVALLLTGLAGCKEEEKHVAEVRPVRVMTVVPATISEERVAVGEIKPRRESDLGFRVAGKIVARTAAVGAIIAKGDILASIEDQDYLHRQQQSVADVKAAEAVYSEAQATEARQRRLLASGVTANSSYDAARKALLSSEAALQSARVAQKIASDQLSYTQLKAEYDGIVTATGAEVGQVVNTGQMIVRLAPLNERDAVFDIAESTLQEHYFQIGADVSVALLSDPGIMARGKVREVSPIADPATRTFEVKVALDTIPEQFLFGSSIRGRVVAEGGRGVALPPTAIFDKEGKPAVWLYIKDTSAVTLRPVTVDRYGEDRVIVTDGLAEGDVVVTAGVNRLREGQSVRPATEEKPL